MLLYNGLPLLRVRRNAMRAFWLTTTVLLGLWCGSGARVVASVTAGGHAVPLHTAPYHLGRWDTGIPCAQPGVLPHCYTPAALQAAYGVTPLLAQGITGAGRTIGILDAYGSPTMAHDLHAFDQAFHLPDPAFTTVAPQGKPPFDPTNGDEVAWAGETTLDVEWAHAIAPRARIVLIIARSDADPDLLAATRWAVEHHVADDLSQSYGEAEDCAAPAYLRAQHQIFAQAVRAGITPIAAAGDSGAALPDCHDTGYHKAVSSPASDPYVLAVGGTRLLSPARGGERQETTWNNGLGATGGGYSRVYSRPGYQNPISAAPMRGLPDVASDADPQTGVLVVWSSSGYGPDQSFTYGGTSAGAPVWAGIIALTAQRAGHGLGWVNLSLYAIVDPYPGRVQPQVMRPIEPPLLFDITTGTNTVTVPDATGGSLTIRGYAAAVGWDAVSGWGSPDALRLVPVLGHD
jgi:subtilase family serine protease